MWSPPHIAGSSGRVEAAPLTPDWEGTTIIFEVEDTGDGATIHFRHQGLDPRTRVLRHVPRGLDALHRQPGLLRRDRSGTAEPRKVVEPRWPRQRGEWRPDAGAPRHRQPRRNRRRPAGAGRPQPARHHPAHSRHRAPGRADRGALHADPAGGEPAPRGAQEGRPARRAPRGHPSAVPVPVRRARRRCASCSTSSGPTRCERLKRVVERDHPKRGTK